MPRIVACGGRQSAYESFCTAVAPAPNPDTAHLLVDAEGPVSTEDPWVHLRACDGWSKPDGTTSDQCHLMVQLMESWFLADRTALQKFYGQGFQPGALPGSPRVESVPKSDALEGLKAASRQSAKGPYDKGGHGFAILGAIDPDLVARAAPFAKRFLDTMRAG